jgi:hypothetical protein
MVIVKFTKDCAADHGIYRAGEKHSLPPDIAQEYVDHHAAVFVDGEADAREAIKPLKRKRKHLLKSDEEE